MVNGKYKPANLWLENCRQIVVSATLYPKFVALQVHSCTRTTHCAPMPRAGAFFSFFFFSIDFCLAVFHEYMFRCSYRKFNDNLAIFLLFKRDASHTIASEPAIPYLTSTDKFAVRSRLLIEFTFHEPPPLARAHTHTHSHVHGRFATTARKFARQFFANKIYSTVIRRQHFIFYFFFRGCVALEIA